MSQRTIKTKTINYKKLSCPTCQTKGQYTTDNNENKYCTNCGLIIETPYPYVAGKRHYTLSNFQNKEQ